MTRPRPLQAEQQIASFVGVTVVFDATIWLTFVRDMPLPWQSAQSSVGRPWGHGVFRPAIS